MFFYRNSISGRSQIDLVGLLMCQTIFLFLRLEDSWMAIRLITEVFLPIGIIGFQLRLTFLFGELDCLVSLLENAYHIGASWWILFFALFVLLEWRLLIIFLLIVLNFVLYGPVLRFGGGVNCHSQLTDDSLLKWADTSIRLIGQHKAFDAVILTAFWCIWNFRNSVIYRANTPKKSLILMMLFINHMFGFLVGVVKPRLVGPLGFIILLMLLS